MKLFDLFKSKSCLGIDIGTSAIKIVQLSRGRDTFTLENYGEVKFFSETAPMEIYQQSSLKMPDEQVAELVRKIIKETGASATRVAMSLPVFSSFSTIIELPPMPEDEMEKAIQFEARQYVPIPLSEVALDWVALGEERKKREQDALSSEGEGKEREEKKDARADAASHQRKKIEVLLIAVPNEIKKRYTHIAELAGLKLEALEMETFPLARALLKGNPAVTAVVDIGARSTDICIADGGFVRISHNFEFSGVDITKAYGAFTKSDYTDAEKKKKAAGLNLTPGQLAQAGELLAVVDDIISETERITHSYFNKTGREVTQVALAGGVSRMPGFLERFRERFSSLPQAAVVVGNPFAHLSYPRELEKTLEEIGPSFAVAVGLAMRR